MLKIPKADALANANDTEREGILTSFVEEAKACRLVVGEQPMLQGTALDLMAKGHEKQCTYIHDDG